MTTYKISVLTLQKKTLTFHVTKYQIICEGTYIQFTDQKTKRILAFHTTNTEIEEIK